MLILQLARKHGGLGWVANDSQFRQQAAAGAPTPWFELNRLLMAATVFNGGGEASVQACSLCLASDHSAPECALASLDSGRPPSKPPTSSRTSTRPKPYRIQEEVCWRFNRGTCSSPSCRFEHICASCQKPGHASFECKKGASKGSTAEPLAQHPKVGQP